ncbi:hypothetical protein K469DRAFT_727228 [Zopfia rhizophila CBS 207.26]|uniref:CCZ1/INTU/HSP4 first Longin domain-containing protein n=1 Tax=Zopfia rhizophila CBS 207.26 TaxID=1314779 RepID=A0A6A6DZ17_9PEZI|nr:hypothetical protein K469DRAFT_727228 [Zopfia rhizophila CBS 207.26]
MSSTSGASKVVPAQLSFLAIYNPSLGDSDETIHDQIVFYHSKAAKARSKIDGRNPHVERDLREQENEKLRQVGLAQGMVDFARSFSNGETVDSVETHKSRIVLHELESGWWILASIDLTQLPAAATDTSKKNGGTSESSAPTIEYSAREVSPPALLLQQLVRTHSIFLLHHASTLSDLFGRLERSKFCNILDRFWTRFASSWDVLLHGSPAVDIFGGLKLAAGGELGIGVGEEEWGSGEREVLEDFARRTDGLVDVMVSRFGEPSPLQHPKSSANSKVSSDTFELKPWVGSGKYASAADGVVFSGVGALTRRSLRDVSHWVESIYCYGDYAYGVRDNPTADRRKRRRNPKAAVLKRPSLDNKKFQKQTRTEDQAPSLDRGLPPGIPPPIVMAVEASLDKASTTVDSTGNAEATKSEPIMASLGDAETWMKYLTLGYGTAWGGKRSQSPEQFLQSEADGTREPSPEISMHYVEPEPDIDHAEEKLKTQIRRENDGYFILGLKGDMEENVDDDNDEGAWNNRIPLRTIHVELTGEKPPETPGEGDETPSYEKELNDRPSTTRKLTRLRPVVYVHRPFIYTFLFHHRTESLNLASFYRNLHTYFSPLHRPLSNSTSPDKVAARIAAASHPHTTIPTTTSAGPNTQPIYDLVYDPRTFTVHSSIPNVPEPGTLVAEGLSSTSNISSWSRVEALNVHSQILATVVGTRRTLSEIERTCKTSRGWWVVWMRLPSSQTDPPKEGAESEGFDTAELREAFLVRRARDALVSLTKSSGSRMTSGMWRLGGPSTGDKMGGAAAGWGPRGLTEGIGIDARRYVEGLLSLNR